MGCSGEHLVKEHLVVGGEKLADAGEVTSHLVNISLTDTFGGAKVCTGVFVGLHTILTAKHCVGNDLNDLSVTFRPKDYQDTGKVVNLTIVDSRAVVVSPEVRDDLILLKFSEALPRAAKIAKVSSINKLANKKSFAVAGYGMHARKNDTQNLKLIYDDQARFKSILVSQVKNFKNYFIIDQQKAGGGVCSGDSGGPAYYMDSVTKKMNIIGIASAVSHEDAASNCLDKSYIIKTDFLTEQAE